MSRRQLFGFAGAAAAGVAVGVGGAAVIEASDSAASAVGTTTVPFHGTHQAGIATPAPARAELVAFDLSPGSDRAAVVGLMRDWTELAAALSAGRSHPLDPTPALAGEPAALTVTFGFGPRLFDIVGRPDLRPNGVVHFADFQHDEIDPAWSEGDLLVQVCAEDTLTVTHAVAALSTAAGGRAGVRWRQAGFGRGPGVAEGQTGRNLMGNKDGTGNDSPDSPRWAETVWARSGPGVPDWYVGGTTVVVRRIRMELDDWYAASSRTRDRVIGREMDSGAPLGEIDEFDPVPLTAQNPDGSLQIPSSSHVRLAHPDSNGGARIVRRGWNYAESGESGLIFVAFNSDATTGFLPIQSRISAGDDLNRFTTAIGSATFAIPPGAAAGEYIGQGLLES